MVAFPGTGSFIPDVGDILLNMKWLMYGILCLDLSTSLWGSCPRAIFAKRIGQVTTDPSIPDLYTILRIINRSVRGLASDSLGCLEPWMNHLPPVRWTAFRFGVLNVSGCVNWVERDFFIAFLPYILPSFTYHFPLKWFHSQRAFFIYKVLRTVTFCRRNRYPF